MQSKSDVTLIELRKLIKSGNEFRLFFGSMNIVLYGSNIIENFDFSLHRMFEKKKEAEAAVDLMSAQYERNYLEEEKRNGLLIISAIYGKIDDEFKFDSTAMNGNHVIDVKIPLQCLVRDSKLVLQENGKVTRFIHS